MNIVLCVRPIVGATKRLRGTKRRESIVRIPIVMGTDRCTITSGRWYRMRHGVIKDGLVYCKSGKLTILG
jgi:hypothetical protein